MDNTTEVYFISYILRALTLRPQRAPPVVHLTTVTFTKMLQTPELFIRINSITVIGY